MEGPNSASVIQVRPPPHNPDREGDAITLARVVLEHEEGSKESRRRVTG